MTARTRSFLAVVAAFGLLLSAVALAASPAEAKRKGNVGPRKHEVTMYKVEQQVDLSGEYPATYEDTFLRCNSGDIVTDGSWVVNHVDQLSDNGDPDPDPDDPSYYGDERDVVVYASWPDNDRRRWNFRLENLSEGNAQVKLYIMCIKGKTEANAGHKHGIKVSSIKTFTHTTVAPSGDTLQAANAYKCPSGYFPITPGFNFLDDDWNRIYRSWPTADKGWQFAFRWNTTPPAKVKTYLSCISKKVDPAKSKGESKQHTHKIPMTFRPGFGGYAKSISGKGTRTVYFACDTGKSVYHAYKAVVGAFWIDDYDHVWYIGNEPQPKARVYHFLRPAGGSDSVYTGNFCIRGRSLKQIKP